MEEQGGPAHTYVGELYFSAHRGTYTSQAMVKKNNRKSELALREMEMWSCLAETKGWEYPLAEADALWKKLLLHQFHDILPGSSIARVYTEAEQAFEEIFRDTSRITADAADSLLTEQGGDAVTVFNSLSFDRKALVTLSPAFADGACTAEGLSVSTQAAENGVKALVELPSCGGVTLVPCTTQTSCEGARIEKTEEGFVLENEVVKAVINQNGEVTSFRVKETGREFAAAPMNCFHLYKDVPRLFDAWDIDSNYIDQEVEGARDITVEILSQGLEAVLRVTGRISESTYTQHIRLAADSRRLVFDTQVDWKELHRLWKVAFPVAVYAENGINEMQFGYVERPAHRSKAYDKDRFEVCNHRYSALCDAAHGAAVLNDCKYGISMNGNRLELTLLRAPSAPEMRADNRVHTFTYAFTAWEGSFADCDVVRQGYELNVPALVMPGSTSRFSQIQIDRENILLDTMKPAEDGSGDIILRLYESKKAAVPVRIHTEFQGYRPYLCDMLENIAEEIPSENGDIQLSFRAFEVKTIRLVKN